MINGKWQGWFNKQARIPLTIGVITNDQDSTDQLMELVMLPLDNLRQVAGGSLLCSSEPGHNWAVILPLVQDVSPTSGVNITDDNKDQRWFANIDIVVDAEDTFSRFQRDTGLVFKPEMRMIAGGLQDLLAEWAQAEGMDPPRQDVGEWLRENGCRQKQRRVRASDGQSVRRRFWLGVGLKDGEHTDEQSDVFA